LNPSDDKPNFLQPSTLIAFAILLVAWFGWSRYLESKYPHMNDAPAEIAADAKKVEATKDGQVAVSAPQTGQSTATVTSAPSAETNVAFNDDTWTFDLSSRGMAVKNINLKKYQTRDDKPIRLAETASGAFATYALGAAQPIAFTVEQLSPNKFVGHAEIPGAKIEKTITVNSENYTFDTVVKIDATSPDFKGLSTELADLAPEAEGGGMLRPATDFISWFVRHDEKVTRQRLTKKDGWEAHENNVGIAALSAHYFALATVDKSEIAPKFETKIAAGATEASGRLNYEVPSAGKPMTLSYLAFAGPKSYNLLHSIDEKLPLVIDYGMFAIFAKPILWLLKFLFSIFNNWGWAIIVLTIIVRLIVLPFNAYSYKSMKVMQKLQPEMARIRERYKDKPADQKLQMNQEVMALMKQHKANPLGGCLPMLLQLPVFFALYQVLGQSIELYRAPFIFWLHDLSLKDPYYVLPVLMGVTMFIQQKITPTTMDPQQAKVMMWMPVIFSFFMVSLPSGLTLYIFVSTLFGITQQYMFMRDRTPKQSVREAKA
jgi:YidC/Oxa1 family membrane protein insertase